MGCSLCIKISAAEQTWVVYDPPGGKPPLKNIVLISGDEEYRSEEGLPMLAKILSQRHGFKCTVLFSLDPDGTINPNNQESVPNAERARYAPTLIVMLLRYRKWPAADMKHFVDAYKRGVPIIGLRTSTHAFNYPGGHRIWRVTTHSASACSASNG